MFPCFPSTSRGVCHPTSALVKFDAVSPRLSDTHYSACNTTGSSGLRKAKPGVLFKKVLFKSQVATCCSGQDRVSATRRETPM